MVLLIFNNQLSDDCITDLPTDELRASHDAHQNRTRMGLHVEIPCLQQEVGVAAVQTNLDTANRVPPYLKRKLVMRHEATDGTSWTSCNCNCKASEGKLAMLSDSDASTVSDDGDWIHSDYSDDDEDEALRQLGVGVGPSRNGEFPPRVRLLRSKYLLMKRHYDHDRKVTAARARSWKIHPDPPCSAAGRKRKRNDTEMAATETSESESHDRNCNNDDLDEGSTTSKRPRQRLRSRHASCAPDFVQRVEGGLGGLPANTDRACEVAAPPILPVIPRHLSESALSVGCRRSQRIRKKLGSACGNSPIRRS